jgi:ligand-binding sensor domain-containing protein
MIDNEKTTKFTDNKSPLSKAYISQMYEDNKGNLWFDLYNEKGSDAGIYVLRIDGTWERITHKNQKVFSGNSVNNFLLDEDKNILWITLNNVGILRYDILKKDWEIYTNENSNVPSVNIEKITKDKDGAIWAATYAGVIRLDIK